MFDYDDPYNYDAYRAAFPGPCSAMELKWSHRHAMSWNTFTDNIKVFPQHSQQAHEVIEKHLGYDIRHLMTFRHEPFIRALIEEHRQGRLTEQAFNDAVAVHVKHIRNDDMQHGGWATPYTEADYNRYDTYLVQFKERARNRLVKNLDFEPPLDYSLDAEIMLREQFMFDGFLEDQHIHTAIDCKAYTIVFYRMALAEDGREVANDLDLMGII